MSDPLRPDNEHTIRSERFMRLLMPVYKRLEDFAFAMARDPEEARDLVAQTVLLAFEHFGRLRDDQAFLGYLFTIASREFQRRRRRARWFGPFSQESAERIECGGPPPNISADVDLLYKALAKLPRREREAVVFFEISGFSMKEIQEIQGGSLSSVKVRIFRARRRLAEMLGADDRSIAIRANGDAINDTIDAVRENMEGDDGYMISLEARFNG